MHRVLAVFVFVTLLFVPFVGHADKGKEKPEAKAALEAFKTAQTSYEDKNYEAALTAAKKAVDLSGSPNARLYVARSLRELGKLAEAHAEMERTLKEARDLADAKDTKYAATRDAAAAELALLDQKVAKIIVALADAPPNTSVTLNGTPLPAAKVGKPFAVEPGKITVRAQPADGAVVEKSVELAAGATETVTLVLGNDPSAVPDEPVEPTPTAPTDAAPNSKGGSLRTIGFITAGVGVVGIAVFAVAGSMSNSKFDEVESECGGQRCSDPKYADTIDSGKRFETIANVGLVVGGVGLLAGGAMILFGGPTAEKTGSASVDVRPGRFQLGYARSF
jgi:hypothetical protein